MPYGTLALDTISTSGNLAVVGNVAVTGNVATTGTLQPSALLGIAVNTAPVFRDSAGTEIGTLCRAWVKITGTATPGIGGSFNVSSITDLGVGQFRVNFTSPLPNANFVGFVTFDGNWNLTGSITAQTTTTATVVSRNGSAGAYYDPSFLYVGFFA